MGQGEQRLGTAETETRDAVLATRRVKFPAAPRPYTSPPPTFLPSPPPTPLFAQPQPQLRRSPRRSPNPIEY